MPHQVYFRILAVELLHFPSRETYSSRTEQIIQMCRGGCSGYRSDPRFARQHPHEGELRRSNPFPFRPFSHQSHERHIVLQGFGRELRQVPAAVALVETAVLVDYTREERTSQRTIRHEADTELFQHREDFGFRLPPPDGILALYSRKRADGVRPADGTRTRFR